MRDVLVRIANDGDAFETINKADVLEAIEWKTSA